MVEEVPRKAALSNQAVLWHLQLCLRALDHLQYRITAVSVASAIDALHLEALSDTELSKMDADNEGSLRLLLELFEKHGTLGI